MLYEVITKGSTGKVHPGSSSDFVFTVNVIFITIRITFYSLVAYFDKILPPAKGKDLSRTCFDAGRGTPEFKPGVVTENTFFDYRI